jgi:hypothetical protein
METVLSISVGVGLSAACGFRVFVPFLLMSVASLAGHLDLAPGFDWIGTYYALAAFGTATVVEILGYYIPWVDNLLDTIATPAAVVAGTVATAALVSDLSPFLKWALALIAGGGAAGIVQLGTVALRGTSSATTGGLGNFVVSTGELLGSIFMAIVAIVLPLLAIVLVLVGCTLIFRVLRRLFFRRQSRTQMNTDER